MNKNQSRFSIMVATMALAVMAFALPSCAALQGGVNETSDTIHDLCVGDLQQSETVRSYAQKAGFDVVTYVTALCGVNEVLRQYEILPLEQARVEAVKAAQASGALPQ